MCNAYASLTLNYLESWDFARTPPRIRGFLAATRGAEPASVERACAAPGPTPEFPLDFP